MKAISKCRAGLLLLLGPMLANAALVPINSGALINDTTYDLMWVGDGNLMATQASNYPGGAAAYVNAVIAASGGVVLDPIRPGTYNLTAADFDTTTGAMSWYGAIAWVNYLNVTSYQGYQDWRLPEVLINTMSSIGTPDGNPGNPPISSSELAELFYGQLGQVAGSDIRTTHNANYGLFSNVQSAYFFGSVYSSIPPRVWLFNTTIGDQRGLGLPAVSQAIAVRSGSVTLSPGFLNFGVQLVGTASTPQSVELTNTGSSPLAIDNVVTDGDGYQQTNTCGASLPSAASCSFDVTMTPRAPGTQPGLLLISSGNTILSVALTGQGTNPVSLSASSTNVTVGVPVTLTWTGPSGASCSASGGSPGDGWSGNLGASGTKSLTESAARSYSYTVPCSIGSQTTMAEVTVAMTVPTATLSAAPASVAVGQTITLEWSSTDADSCSATGGSAGDGWSGNKILSGMGAVSESSPGLITFTITCASGPQSASASTQVTVTAPHSGGGGSFDVATLMLLLGVTAASRHLTVKRGGVGRL